MAKKGMYMKGVMFINISGQNFQWLLKRHREDVVQLYRRLNTRVKKSSPI